MDRRRKSSLEVPGMPQSRLQKERKAKRNSRKRAARSACRHARERNISRASDLVN